MFWGFCLTDSFCLYAKKHAFFSDKEPFEIEHHITLTMPVLN